MSNRYSMMSNKKIIEMLKQKVGKHDLEFPRIVGFHL